MSFIAGFVIVLLFLMFWRTIFKIVGFLFITVVVIIGGCVYMASSSPSNQQTTSTNR